MEKLVAFVFFMPALVLSQQNCDVTLLVECINTFSRALQNLNDVNTATVCPPYNYFKSCVFSLPNCDATNALTNTLSQLPLNGFNVTAMCSDAVVTTKRPWTTSDRGARWETTRYWGAVTTHATSGCDLRDISKCINSLEPIIKAANGDKNRICPAAQGAVSCLNVLIACVSTDEFSQARRWIEESLKLPEMCPMLQEFPLMSGATTYRSVLPLAVWTLFIGYILA